MESEESEAKDSGTTTPLFEGVKFYVSGEINDDVIELLKNGGAERMNYFSDYVTHLLCGSDAEDNDVCDANDLYEIPAVTSKWIYMCVKLNKVVDTKPYVYNLSKLFSNLVFCLSKPEKDLYTLWALITYYGGRVKLNFDNKCTHLVTTNTTTAKYIKAFSLGPEKVQIVTPDWIVESIKCNGLVKAELFHPKLIKWPRVVKHESTTAITGFEPPEQADSDEKPSETNTPDSTQALLDKLKQRMPWNQPQSSAASEIAPPNVVAPSYTQNKLPQMDQIRSYNQQTTQPQLQSPVSSTSSFNQNISVSGQQIPRSMIHHAAQPQQQQQQQQQFPQQQQQQQSAFQQMSLSGSQPNQMSLNRLIGQQPRPSLAQQLNKLSQMNSGQQSQFQQLLQQRAQLAQLNQQQQLNQNQIAQSVAQQITQSPAQSQQNIAQRTAVLSQLNKSMGMHGQQVIQHIQQLGNRPHLPGNQMQLQNQQLAQQLNPNQQQLVQNQQQQLVQNQQQLVQNQQQQLVQSQQQQLVQSQQQQLVQNQQQQLVQNQQQLNQQQISQQQLSQGQLHHQNQQQIVLNQQIVQQQQQQNQQLVQQQQQLTQSQSISQQINQHIIQQQQNQQQQQLAQMNQNQQQQLTQEQREQLVQHHLKQGLNPQLQQQRLGQNQVNQQQQQQQFGNLIQQQQPQQSIEQQLLVGQSQQTQMLNQNQQQQQLLNQNQQQQMLNQQNQQQQLISQNQFQQQAVINQGVTNISMQNQQQFVSVSGPQQFSQSFVQQPQQSFNQNTQILQGQQQQQQQQFVQQNNQQQSLNQQLGNQTVLGNQQPQQMLAHPQMLISQQQPQQQQSVQFVQGVNQPNLANQAGQPRPIAQHLWQQQQAQQQPEQMGMRHPGGIAQQNQQVPRVQWSPNQQQRQVIQLDAKTHMQLQQMAPEQRALFVAKLQKQRQLFLQQRQQQLQLQQQRGGHILIRGQIPPGLSPQQQMQWLQQQAKQQGVVLQQNVQQQQPANLPPAGMPAQGTLPQHTPGLSPIQQTQPPQFAPEQSQHMQLQRQYRLQQLQLQREQAQKTAAAQPLAQQPPGPPAGVARPVGQPQTAEAGGAAVGEPAAQAPHPLVVNAKTKTALANMLSIRLQSGGGSLGPGTEGIAEPSAAGTLRLMTAQHNAALNSNNRPQDILGLQQRRALNPPAADLVRPPVGPIIPPPPQADTPKLQYSPRPTVPLQHRPGTFYGHNPNLKLPPDLFLLGCIFVVVELERYLEESIPGWQQTIEKHGGEIEPQYCSRVTHVLCETQRHGVVMQALRDYKRCVTLYWLSDVIKRKQVLPPWTALHLPMMYLDSAPAWKHLIALSGFDGHERTRVKHMITYTGAKFTSYFSKHNTLLIAAKAEGRKYMHAKKCGIPVVNVQWLTDIMLGNFSALNQLDHAKYQQFSNPPNFSFDPITVPNLMQAWKMPINISQESYERVKRSPSPVLIPKAAKKLKTENTTDENDNDTQIVPTMPHRILFSMCDASLDELKKIVKQLGGSIATSPADCTHLVMPRLIRSQKLMLAVARGAHVVPESWLRDSAATGQFLDESNHTFDAKDFNGQYGCDFAQTLATRGRGRLFEGRYFFVTPSVFPSRRDVVELIRACGGVVERVRRTAAQIEATNVNSPYSYVIVTHESDLHLVADLLKNKKEKVRIVCNAELVYSAILKQTFEVEPFAVKVL